MLATNFGRMKNDPNKQRKVAVQYVELCGRRLGDNQWVSHNDKPKLTQSEIAQQLGVSVPELNRMLEIERKLTPEIKDSRDNMPQVSNLAHLRFCKLVIATCSKLNSLCRM